MNSKERYWNVRDYLESFLQEAEPYIGKVTLKGMKVMIDETEYGSRTVILLDLDKKGVLSIRRLVEGADINWEVYEPFSIGLDANVPVDTFFHSLVSDLLVTALHEQKEPVSSLSIAYSKR